LLQSDITSDFYYFVLSQLRFAKEQMQYENITKKADNGWINSDDRDRELDNLRVLLSEKKETILWSFSYLHKFNIIPLLIFDDLDPLDIEFHKYIYNEIYYLRTDFKIKTILSIRPRINDRLERYNQGAVGVTINARIYLEFPNLKKYLEGKEKRIESIVRELDIKEILIDNYKIIPEDIITFFKNYFKIMLLSDTRNFVINISGGNMRICNELIHIYLRSGYVNSAELIAKIINQTTNQTVLLPQWIVYSSIITYNHYTVFGQYDGNDIIDHKVYPVNILCNGNDNLNPLLLRFHLLSMFVRQDNNYTVEQIKEKYKKIITECNESTFNRSINRAIKRFNNGGLISSPTFGFIKMYENIRPDDEFRKEELGEYYIRDIIKIFEYLSFMKDDTNFGDNPLNIKSCIDVSRHIDRFTEVVKYLQHLYHEETIFYRNIEPQERDFYKEIFSPIGTSKLLYVQVLTENMIDYARKRMDMINRGEFDAATRNDLSTLSDGETILKNILDECRKFLANL